MSADEFRVVVHYLFGTQEEAARMLGISRKHVGRFCNGSYPVPRQTALLLSLMRKHGVPEF